jgi:hypothetical protein
VTTTALAESQFDNKEPKFISDLWLLKTDAAGFRRKSLS